MDQSAVRVFSQEQECMRPLPLMRLGQCWGWGELEGSKIKSVGVAVVNLPPVFEAPARLLTGLIGLTHVGDKIQF